MKALQLGHLWVVELQLDIKQGRRQQGQIPKKNMQIAQIQPELVSSLLVFVLTLTLQLVQVVIIESGPDMGICGMVMLKLAVVCTQAGIKFWASWEIRWLVQYFA
eukprot:GFUD01099664.1.p1 GENE.GFUD01099664.1~~GFUD01099664.1.p1  ORF type:complete len:105 (+),score=14.43 GFUD01099664.1:543-857(+)